MKRTFCLRLCSIACVSYCIAWGGIAVQVVAAEPSENTLPQNRFRTADETADDELDEDFQALRDKDAERITVGQVSHFHMLFIERCLDKLPQDVAFQYAGPLVTEGSRRGQRVHGPPAGILEWNVQHGVVIFSVWISSIRTTHTVVAFPVGETELFTNVSFVDENRSIDEKLPKLGDRSVKEVLLDLVKSVERE